MAEVIWAEPALLQLRAIVEFIALDKPDAAAALARRIFATTDQLGIFLKLGRPIPEFPHKDYRHVWIKPCWLYYRMEKYRVVILHIRRAEQLFHPEDLLE